MSFHRHKHIFSRLIWNKLFPGKKISFRIIGLVGGCTSGILDFYKLCFLKQSLSSGFILSDLSTMCLNVSESMVSGKLLNIG